MYLIWFQTNPSQRMSWGGALPENMELIDLAALIPGERCKRSEFYSLFLVLTMVAVCSINREDWFESRSGAYFTITYRNQRYYQPLISLACHEYEAMGKERSWLIERSKRIYQLSVVSLRFSGNGPPVECHQARRGGGLLAKKQEEGQKERYPRLETKTASIVSFLTQSSVDVSDR